MPYSSYGLTMYSEMAPGYDIMRNACTATDEGWDVMYG
jgi:hypothetical protein